MCPTPGDDRAARDTSGDTPPASKPDGAAPRRAGFGQRDFEVIDARRVERADLVRDVLRRRRDAAVAEARPDGAPAGEGRGPATTLGDGGASGGGAAEAREAAEPDTDDTVALKRDGEGRIIYADGTGRAARAARARRLADGDAAAATDADGTARETAAGSASAQDVAARPPRLRELPGALTGETPNLDDTIRLARDPVLRRRTGPARDASAGLGSAEGAAPPTEPHPAAGPAPDAHDPSSAAPPTARITLPTAEPRPEATPADASAAAIGILRAWRADAEAHAQAVAEAQLAARTERGRDKLDPAGDLRRAAEASGGRAFLRELLDDVVRPDDRIAAGNGLGDLAHRIPPTISQRARRAFRLGVLAGPGIPWVAVPALRRTAHTVFDRELVVDEPPIRSAAAAHAAELGALARATPLGDPVVGYARAAERLRRLAELVADPAFAEVEFTVADIEPAANLWDLDGTVERIAVALAPVYQAALGGPQLTPTFLSLRATGSHDLEVAVRVFMRLLDEPALRHLEAGISLPAELPETTGLLRRLAGWAHMRREDLGAPITVGITRAGDIALERADAVLHGWRLASFTDEHEVDASVVRLLDQALHADHAAALRVEVDGEVLRDAAIAIAIAAARGARMRVVVPVGMGDAAIERLRAAGAVPVQRLPLVPSEGMRPAVPYLLRRVDQEADSVETGELSEARVTGRDALHPDDDRLLDAVGRMFQLPGGTNRHQERVDADDAATVTASIQLELFPEGVLDDDAGTPGTAAAAATSPAAISSGDTGGLDLSAGTFASAGAADAPRPALPAFSPTAGEGAGDGLPTENPADTGPSARLTEIVLGLRRGRFLRNTFRSAPNTDPTVAANRDWAARIQRRIGRSVLGEAEALEAHLTEPEAVEAALQRAVAAGPAWREKPGWERAAYLERVAKALEANRARLIEVAVTEFGVPLSDADGDVSRAVDTAAHAAYLARQLDRMQGAAFHPVGLSVVLPSASPPITGASLGALTALAAGSAVIIKASPKTRRTAAVVAGVLWAAEIPRDLVQLTIIDEDPVSDEQLGRRLVTDDRVGRVLMNGTWESARTLKSWRPDLPLIAGTSGKNAVIVTPAADLDRAARDIARSAFLTTGQRAGHVGTVILVGSVARSTRFLQQLADAVTSMAFGYPSDPSATAGPLVQAADATLRFALTQLGDGERWLVEPRQLDDTGRLWSPGVRLGVQPGSYTHVTEFFGPVLGVMHALTLDQAIELQNATKYGLVAGLQSLDRAEIGRWIDRVQAGSLFINRDTLGYHVQRHPFGGWRRSAVGTQQKSGGPNSLMTLGEWRIDPGQPSPTLHLRGMDERAVRLIEAAQPSLDYAAFDRVRRTALSCQIAWNEEFGEVRDVTGLAFERNLFRYLPAAVTVRLAEGAPLEELVRVLAGARIVRAVPDVSVPEPLPEAVAAALAELQFPVRVERDAEFAGRAASEGLDSLRVRLIGGSRRELLEALGGDPDVAVWSGPVTFAGRVELLPFLREQSITITAHRHGRPDARVAGIFAHEHVLDPERPFGVL